jgi:hypothetical protein
MEVPGQPKRKSLSDLISKGKKNWAWWCTPVTSVTAEKLKIWGSGSGMVWA